MLLYKIFAFIRKVNRKYNKLKEIHERYEILLKLREDMLVIFNSNNLVTLLLG